MTFSLSESLIALCGLVNKSNRASSSSLNCSPIPRCSSSFRLLAKASSCWKNYSMAIAMASVDAFGFRRCSSGHRRATRMTWARVSRPGALTPRSNPAMSRVPSSAFRSMSLRSILRESWLWLLCSCCKNVAPGCGDSVTLIFASWHMGNRHFQQACVNKST